MLNNDSIGFRMAADILGFVTTDTTKSEAAAVILDQFADAFLAVSEGIDDDIFTDAEMMKMLVVALAVQKAAIMAVGKETNSLLPADILKLVVIENKVAKIIHEDMFGPKH